MGCRRGYAAAEKPTQKPKYGGKKIIELVAFRKTEFFKRWKHAATSYNASNRIERVCRMCYAYRKQYLYIYRRVKCGSAL